MNIIIPFTILTVTVIELLYIELKTVRVTDLEAGELVGHVVHGVRGRRWCRYTQLFSCKQALHCA